jgi:hypothetical protein
MHPSSAQSITAWSSKREIASALKDVSDDGTQKHNKTKATSIDEMIKGALRQYVS